MKIPRLLKADEIECRVQSLSMGKGANEGKCFAILLLYKDARSDMNILDETYGCNNWQRDHKTENGNLFGGVGVWDEDKSQWIWKWDAGKESNQDAQKGHASDAFKRACVNLGIGRELYTAPFIYFELLENEWYMTNGKPKATNNARFSVKSITYNDNREISNIEVADKKGVVRLRR